MGSPTERRQASKQPGSGNKANSQNKHTHTLTHSGDHSDTRETIHRATQGRDDSVGMESTTPVPTTYVRTSVHPCNGCPRNGRTFVMVVDPNYLSNYCTSCTVRIRHPRTNASTRDGCGVVYKYRTTTYSPMYVLFKCWRWTLEDVIVLCFISFTAIMYNDDVYTYSTQLL